MAYLTARRTASAIESYEIALKGVPIKVLKDFMDEFDLTQKQMAPLLGVSEKTIYNILTVRRAKEKDKQLDTPTSDRFLMVLSVFNEGVETLMGIDTFRSWLVSPHFYLKKKTPLEMMSTINGAEAVRAELIRTKHGILS